MFGLNLRKLFYLFLLVAVVFVGIQYGRAYLTRYQFDDAVRQSVKYAAASRKGPEAIRREVLETAEELGIDIGPKDIHITERGPALTLELEYDWTVDLKVYQHVLTFPVSENGEVFAK